MSEIHRFPTPSTPAVRTIAGTIGISPRLTARGHAVGSWLQVRIDFEVLRCGVRTPAFPRHRTSGTSVRRTGTRSSSRPSGIGSRGRRFSAACTARSFSWPVARNSPNVRSGAPFRQVFHHQGASSGWLMRSRCPVYSSEPSPLTDDVSQRDRADRARPGSVNPPSAVPVAVKNWSRAESPGTSATTKLPSGAESNAVGRMMRPVSAPDLDDFCGASAPRAKV